MMLRKVLPVLVIVTLFCFSTAFAHDPEEYDNEAGPVLVAGLALVTAAILIASHDRHPAYPPAPRHAPDRHSEYRGMDQPRYHDGGEGGAYRHHDDRRPDSGYQNDEWRRWNDR
jgi:hypothetical protein